MATFEDVEAVLAGLAGVTEGERHGHRTWFAGRRALAWERPFSKADLRRFGEAPVPSGPILAVTVADLGEKEAVLAEAAPGVFTIPHFDGYAALLVQLDVVDGGTLEDLVVDAWRSTAPAADVAAHRAGDRRPPGGG